MSKEIQQGSEIISDIEKQKTWKEIVQVMNRDLKDTVVVPEEKWLRMKRIIYHDFDSLWGIL
ncbi:MAG: hypothetical protein V1850_00290, partial [Candidatus Bathyarchaeota archaeon]